MTSTESDLRFINESIPQLQEYLLSNELYWPLSGSLPRLTPGALLLALRRVSVTAPAQAQKLNQQVDAVRTRWLIAWEKKAAREISNRVRLWSEFLSDYLRAPDQSLDSYRNEIRGRVIIQLLISEIPDVPELSNLAELDEVIKGRFVGGNFVWDPALQEAFPKNNFWFLYGTI